MIPFASSLPLYSMEFKYYLIQIDDTIIFIILNVIKSQKQNMKFKKYNIIIFVLDYRFR